MHCGNKGDFALLDTSRCRSATDIQNELQLEPACSIFQLGGESDMPSPRKLIVIGLLAIASLIVVIGWPFNLPGAPVVIHGTAVPPVPTLAAARVARGAALYAQHCAACHGANLEGEPNWKQPGADGAFPAPPHDSTGHTWHHSDELLLSITEGGGDPAFNSKMPAFRGILSADEIVSILEFLKSNWDREEREYQWWITARGNPG